MAPHSKNISHVLGVLCTPCAPSIFLLQYEPLKGTYPASYIASALEKEIDYREVTIKVLNKKIERLTKQHQDLENSLKPTHKYEGYPAEKDFITKLAFILSRNATPLTFDEIVGAFTLLEPELKDRWMSLNKSISKIISRAVRFGTIVRTRVYDEYGYFSDQLPGKPFLVAD